MNRKLLTALLALCAALCLLPALALAEGAAGVAIDEANFPDANFRTYVAIFDMDTDKLLSPAELTNVKDMTLINKSIGDLTGIEHFTALTKLDCRWNQLTSLDVSQNTALQVLNCHNNQLTSLVLGGNTALTKLNCINNQLTSLDVSKNTALEELDCGDNQLTSLDVSANTALKQLYCMNNPLTALDVSKNTALTDLNCINTQRASLDVSKNTSLTSLLCGDNLLTSLDVSKNTALTSLLCAKNRLASLDVSKNTALEDLDCRWNQLTSLDVSKNTALKDLDCRWNQLTSLDLSANPKLSFSHCSTNDNTYRLTLDAGRILDLTTLPGFNVTKASYWSGGTVDGTVLTVDGGAEQVTYNYDCGNDITAYFTLTCDKARYTVTFGNDRAPAQTVTHGEKAVEPPKPTEPGQIFKAWYAGNAPYDFNTPVTQNLRLEDWWKICNHSGSTEKSTCTAAAVCTVCGGKIHALKHLWGAWLPDSGAATHTRTCTRGVPHTETEACADNNKDHACDTCGKELTQCEDTNSDHVCDTCGATLTQHSGGTASCTARAVCEVCKAEYGEKLPHEFTAKTVDAKYLKSDATCTAKAVYYKSCTVCGLSSKGTTDEATFTSGNILDHDWGAWTQNSDEKTHTRICKRDTSHTETENCHGGTATCTAKAVCTVCGGEYGEMAAHNFTAEIAEADYLKSAATCTEKAVYYKSCAVCGLSSKGTADEATFFSGNALDHNWGDWTPSSNKTHTRTCNTDNTHTETKNCADDNKDHVCDTCGATLTQHSGGTATCTAPATCGYCGKPYGEKNPANHSDLKHVPAKAATTQAEGNSEYWLCSGCGKCYKDAAAATEIALSDTVIAKRIPRRYSGPTITVMGAAYYDGGNVGLTFVSSADFDTFTGVQVDGKTLAAKNYIAERGSIEVYLKAVYLRTLKNGSHTVTIQSTAGDVSAVFTVENSKTSPGTSDPGVAVYALSSILSLTGLAALRRRKED